MEKCANHTTPNTYLSTFPEASVAQKASLNGCLSFQKEDVKKFRVFCLIQPVVRCLNFKIQPFQRITLDVHRYLAKSTQIVEKI